MADEKVKAMFVFEIMGRPPEHIKKSLEMYVDKLGEAPILKIESKKIHEPKLIEKEGVEDFYTSFAEVELTGDSLEVIMDIVLNMLPSHIEILEPLELKMQNFELSAFFSKLAIKIHKYDEIAKAAMIDKNALIKKLNEMQEKIKELEGGKKSKPKKKTVKKKSKKKK
tara:strand:- start:788 stop:1291 length:504 start_codon:yes stop_codon:yes gene_type:complete